LDLTTKCTEVTKAGVLEILCSLCFLWLKKVAIAGVFATKGTEVTKALIGKFCVVCAFCG